MDVADAHERLGDAGRAGARGARGGASASPRASCRRGCARPTCPWRASDCLVCGTGYTGEDGVEILIPPDGATAVWDALLERGRHARRPRRARHAAARGLLPPLRQRPVRGPQPDRGRPRRGAASSTRASSARTRCAASSRRTRSSRSRSPAPASRARATRSIPSTATASSRAASLSPCLEIGIGMAYVPVAAAEPGHAASRSTCAASARAAEVREKPLYTEGDQWLRPATPRT